MKVIIDGVEYVPVSVKMTNKVTNKTDSDFCNKCGGESKTIDSRYRQCMHKRFRRKQCMACGHRWDTVEYGFEAE